MFDGVEEPTLQVAYLIPFKSCFKGFPVLKYTYVPRLKVGILRVFSLCLLIVFMIHRVITYSKPPQTSKMELFAKLVTFKEVTSWFRRLKEF